ncbi:MAG: beta-propeller domain-containing protein [Myxococcales bacterium]
MTRQLGSLATVAALLAAAFGCSGKKGPTGGGPNGPPPNPVGATDFVSQPPSGQGGARGGGVDAAAGGTAPGTAQNGGSNGGSGAASTPARAIQESDLYAVSGNSLFVLNSYRGLQVLDITNLDQPQLVARVPIVGTPQGLYVEGNTAYVIVSDYFYYDFVDGFGGAEGWDGLPWIGSQVWAVDVSQPSSPVILSQLPVNGSIVDSRIVGNVLYAVSNVWAYYYAWGPGFGGGYGNTSQDLTFVASFDISNPQSMQFVQELDFPADGWNIHDNVTDTRIIISESGYDPASTGPITQFAPIDITDPGGKLALGTLYQAPGTVNDRWAMDFNPQTSLFRAVLNSGWGNSGGALALWNAPDVNHATQVGSLNLNIQEAITAASFDGNRAYLSTSYCTDPLWIIDTTNPAKPAVAGSVSLPGALDFLEPMGNQLIALGHNSSGCNAWEGSGAMAVTLFDVTNAAAPSVLSSVDFGSGYSSVTASIDDMKKAFQVLTQMGLVLVPFQSWNSTNYTYQGGTQLIDLGANSLTLRGFAPQQGSIQRAFPVQDRIVAFSDRALQVMDATNRDSPVVTAKLDMARPVLGLTVVGNQLVEMSGDWSIGDTELAVTNAATPDQAVPNAVVPIPAPNAQTFQDGNIMWVLANDYTNGVAWLQAVDVSNPQAPVLRGKVSINPQIVPNWYGGYWFWGYGDEAVIAGHALAIHMAYYGCYDYCGTGYVNPPDQLYVVDLTNPDAPVVDAPLALPGSDWSWGLTAVGNYAWITHYEWIPDGSWDMVRYYLDRIDLSNPSKPQLLGKINVPGVFFSASADGQTIYTQEVSYSSDWKQVSTWLEELSLQGNGTAVLTAATGLNGYPGSASINNGFAYLETWSWNGGYNGSSQAVLSAIDLNGLGIDSSQVVAADWAWIVSSAGGKLFLEADWYDTGILVYDLAQPGQPQYQGSVRTEGWVENVVVSGNTAYLPSGDYGTPMIDLTPGAPLPSTL